MDFTTNGDVRLAWEEQGEGPPLLLIMGHLFGRQMWHWVLPELAAQHRVITFDNRGVGDSDAPRGAYTIQDMAADAVAVLDAAGAARADVCGLSLGGLIAQEMALSHPDRVHRLILGCTTAGAEGGPAIIGRIRAAIPAHFAVRISKAFLYGKEIPQERVLLDREQFAPQRVPRWGALGQTLAVGAYSARDRLHEITQPTLVLHGDGDRALPLKLGEELAEKIPDARLVVFNGAGHHFIADMPERASAEILEFLK